MKKEKALNDFLNSSFQPAFFSRKKRPVFFALLLGCSVAGGLLFLAGLSLSFAQTSPPAFPFLGEVKINKALNVRAGQSANFEQVAQLRAGNQIVVVDQSYGWYKIKLPIQGEAYVSSAYVKKLAEDIGEVSGNRLNIRARPKTEASILGQLKKGELVRIVDENAEGWLRIEPPENSFGWVAAEYVQYLSSVLPPARIVEAPVRNIYTKKRREEQKTAELVAQQEKQLAEARKDLVSAEGIVVDLGEHALADDVRHRLIVDDKTSYYLKGYRRIFDIFLQNKVKVEGVRQPESNEACPVIFVSKILFVL